MDSSSIVPSSIKALNAGISSHNPFVDASTVREPEIWIDRHADSPQLNIGVRSHLHAAYGRVCQGKTVAAVTLLGQTGTGKTHELNCLRQHVHNAPIPGLFVYLNVQQFSEGQAVRQQFLRAIGDSFVRRMPSGLVQWQQLAIALANHALSGIDNSRKQFSPRSVLELLSRNSLEQNQAWIDRIAEAFFRVRPDIDDPDIVRAIFWTLCPHQLPYARKWLSGLMLPSWKRNELGLPQPRAHNPESQAWQTTLNLLATIEQYAPVTIAFDCFEHPEIPDPGVQKERVAIGLIKWLGDRLRTRTRRFGVLFVSAMHPDTWELVEDHFGPVAQFAHDRGEPCGLQPADAETIEQAIECWLQTFYQARNLVPPTPLYPFDRAQVAALVRESVDLHDAIEWCADNFQPVETDPLEPVELRFGSILRELADEGLGDDWMIAQAIAQAFAQLQGCDLTIDDPIHPADRDESMIPEISEISFRVRDVALHPQSRTFPVTIELEVLNVATPESTPESTPKSTLENQSGIVSELASEIASGLGSGLGSGAETFAEWSEVSAATKSSELPQVSHPSDSVNSELESSELENSELESSELESSELESSELESSELESSNSVNSELENSEPVIPVHPKASDIETQPEPAQILHIGLEALTANNGRQLCAQLDRCWAAIEQEPDQTPHSNPANSVWSLGCLVRPLGSPIPPHWKAAQSYDRFAQHDRGLVIEFSLDDIVPLLALRRLEAEIGDRERVAAASLSPTPSNRSTTTTPPADPAAIDSPSSISATPDLSPSAANSPAAELSSTEETRSAPSSDRPTPSDSAEPTIESTYEREFGLESPRSERPTSTDAANQDAALNQVSNQDDREADSEIEREIEREIEGDPDVAHGEEPLVDPEQPHPEPNDRAALSAGLSNNRWSRFPSAKPIRDLAITRELLATWIDRENIAIDNVIVCTLIGRAVADLVRRDHPILTVSPPLDPSP